MTTHDLIGHFPVDQDHLRHLHNRLEREDRKSTRLNSSH